MRHSIRRFVRRSESGFTMIELIIVLAILLIASLMLLPRLFWFVDRARLRSAALATKSMIQTARLAAMKGGGNAEVVFDYAKGRVYAFVDTNANGVWDAGVDRQLGDYYIREPGKKVSVQFMSHNDGGPNTTGALDKFDDFGTCGGSGCVIFNAGGAAQTAGAVRFTDGYWNFLEVRITSLATGKVVIQKYNRAKNDYFPEVLHLEGGTRAASWDWYEDRDPRVPL
jgi:prepilin-type N-terminal cleavage/methylation domain-containing protein